MFCLRYSSCFFLCMVVCIGKKKERSRIRAMKMDNLRGLLGIRIIDMLLNAWIREMCGMTKGVDERIDECTLWWFSNV